MPDGITAVTREDDPFAWALEMADRVRRGQAALTALDRDAISAFLEEWADDMLATVRSQIVNLLAHAVKVANIRNPDIVGHWRSECVEFHDQLVEVYRPSIRGRVNLALLWRRAQRKVLASFRDHGEAEPSLPAECPVALDELLDPDLDLDRLVATIRDA